MQMGVDDKIPQHLRIIPRGRTFEPCDLPDVSGQWLPAYTRSYLQGRVKQPQALRGVSCQKNMGQKNWGWAATANKLLQLYWV